ncbi:MAG: hypothetical protein ACLS7Z_05055 [Christensenellales bacterium]
MALKKILSPVSDALDGVQRAIVIMLGLMVVITTRRSSAARSSPP